MAEADSKPYGVIYCVQHRASGRRYIGQTTQSLLDRWRAHKRQSVCVLLHRAILKYGAEAFDVTVLDVAGSKQALDDREVFFIDLYKSNRRSHGFNLMSGGSFGKHSVESREKMSIKVRKALAETDLRSRLSLARRRWSHGPEALAKISASNTGKRHSDKTKTELSELRSKLWSNPEIRQRMRDASVTARLDSDFRAKVAEATRAQWQDADARAKLLAAQAAGKAAFWADPEKKAARIAKRRATLERKKSEAAAK